MSLPARDVGVDARPDARTLRRWKIAIFAIFAASGLALATWASRVPAIKDTLAIDNVDVGLMLLVAGAASLVGLSLASVLLARVGARRSMFAAMIVYALGVGLVGVGADLAGSYPLVVLGLALFGLGNGAVDVMMNVEGAAIETATAKTLLPLFHASFSFGTVLGAGAGALAALWGADVFTHASIITALILAIAFGSMRAVPARQAAMDPDAPGARGTSRRARLAAALSAWREPRTYALGIVILGMAFAEGGANDWLALGMVDGHGADEALGALGLATFSVSMTAMRLVGGPLVDRFGRVATLRVLAVTSAVGLLLFILAPTLPLVFVGAALWGAGTSLGFPLGMSAAADDPARAAARVSAAAAIGYLAFLCGPPLLGFLSEQIGLLPTLFLLVVLIVASGLASAATRPLPGTQVGAGRH
ncbi:MFS transporter [Microbacterium sp. LRZ72]|uniref:MFS transporter n=1 Tax=Microbacterium sp. LRZ72 TaxID=2942481 RepID=UPI0029BA3373|nr:MFS transporter [Microbacterium sp. LRZ72]MDX2376265.1 MFS transporter [Microbacterium sp. LRZ72]